MKCIITLLIASLIAGSTASAQDGTPVVKGALGARVDEYMSRMSAFGMSGALMVAKDGQIILRKGYGLADDQRSVPVSAGMPFVIASLSKQFTAAAILKLEMQGKLRTSDTIGRFFPDAPPDKQGITIHQLLTHTAGMAYLEGNMFSNDGRDKTMTRILSLPLNTAPGAVYAYSNPGYALLGGIIERASGVSFEKYLRDNIFEPAGMAATGFMGDMGYTRLNQLHSYSGPNDEGATSEFPHGSDYVGAGSIYSTVDDLYRWEQALNGSTILSDAAREKLFTAHVPVQGSMSYGYGWNTARTIRGTRLVFHAGDVGGYNVEFRRYLDEGLVIIFLSNRRVNGDGYRTAVMNPLSLLIAGAEYPAPPAVVDLPKGKLDRLAGRYELPTGGALLAWTEGDRLMMSAEGQDALLALANPKSVDLPALAELGNHTRQVVLDISRGDFDSLKQLLDPSYPFEDVRSELANDMRQLRDSLGEFKDVEIVGSVMPAQDLAKTFLLLRFQRGTVQQAYSWSGDHISAIEQRAPRALSTRFAPASENTIVSFDAFTGITTRMEFTTGTAGKVSGLNVVTGHGTVHAVRKSSKS